jgi:hypothetical protein
MTNTSAEPTTVLQIIYASAATVPFDDDALLKLLETARTNNAKLGITGMLLYHNGSFLQAIEGDADAVDELYDRIVNDPRHGHERMIFYGQEPARSFGDWSMGFSRIDETDDVPEGFSRFIEDGVLGLSDEDGGLVRQVMLGFRDGHHRMG